MCEKQYKLYSPELDSFYFLHPTMRELVHYRKDYLHISPSLAMVHHPRVTLTSPLALLTEEQRKYCLLAQTRDFYFNLLFITLVLIISTVMIDKPRIFNGSLKQFLFSCIRSSLEILFSNPWRKQLLHLKIISVLCSLRQTTICSLSYQIDL